MTKTQSPQRDEPDLETCLAADTDGGYRRMLCERLARMRDAVEVSRRGFHDKETYRRLQAALTAINAASTALELVPSRPPR